MVTLTLIHAVAEAWRKYKQQFVVHFAGKKDWHAYKGYISKVFAEGKVSRAKEDEF